MDEKKQLKILFFGLGSIGKKHAKIINEYHRYKLMAFRTKKGQEKKDFKIQEFSNINDAFSENPDIAFITNPTFLHAKTALECVKNNIDLFIEKPISHNTKSLDKLQYEIKKRNLYTYVGYNLRFHPVIYNLKSMLNEKPKYFMITCISYLPNWRPYQDYSISYSAKKEQGGGVVLDLSHEFDYITWLFGEIESIKGTCDKVSNLKINSEDLVEAQIRCKNDINGHLHLDCFNKNIQRKIVIYLENKLLEGDLIKNTIAVIDENNKKSLLKFRCKPDETYKKQLDYFFKNYQERKLNIMNNFQEALIMFKKIVEFKENNCKI